MTSSASPAYSDVRTPKDWTAWQGKVIDGKFELIEYLGGAEECAVFLTHLDSKNAAIKLCIVSSDGAQKQIDVWNRTKSLSHPHLIRIFATGQNVFGKAHCLYVVTEYAQEDLSMILPSRPLTGDEAQEMLLPVLDALAYIHGEGLVHGHIKPANIMSVDEQIKISSDGILHPGLHGAWLSTTAAYLPPESARGELAQPADVWALGITLVEALTQQKPSLQISSGEVVLPESVPAQFQKIAEQCLRPDPQERATIADLRSELKPVSSPPSPAVVEPAVSKPAVSKLSTSSREASSGFRHWPLIVIGIVLIALLAGIFWYRHSQLPTAQPAAAQAAPLVAPVTPESPPVAETKAPESPGKVIQQVLPDISDGARRTIRGVIRIRVRVSADDSGSVDTARTVLAGSSRFFAGKALEAAQQWKFDPPLINGKAAPSDWNLEFQLQKTGIKAEAQPATKQP